MIGHFSVIGDTIDDQQYADVPAAQVQEKAAVVQEQEKTKQRERVERVTPSPSSDLATGSSTTREKVLVYFEDTPMLYHVAKCESRWRQYDEHGNPLRGDIDSRDVGVMQINEYYHLSRAQKAGFDIYTLEGNVAYAKYLYQKQGLQPWSASEHCWAGERHVAMTK